MITSVSAIQLCDFGAAIKSSCLSLLFPLLTRLGMTRVVIETKEARRLTIG
ncbi:MAG: hypothetical protein ACE5NP_05045 [Anaerolineae bacterium]